MVMSSEDALRNAGHQLYRRLSVPEEVNKRDIPAQHRAILDAALAAHDEDKAAELLAMHIQRTTDILLYVGFEPKTDDAAGVGEVA